MPQIILLLVLISISVVFYKRHKTTRFKYHAQNPYIRECVKCGAVHNQFHMNYDITVAWWQEVYKGNDEKCECKKHQTDPLPGF